jgi:hypothetical protein
MKCGGPPLPHWSFYFVLKLDPNGRQLSCNILVLMRPNPIPEQNYCAIILFNPSLFNMRTKSQTIMFFDIRLFLFAGLRGPPSWLAEILLLVCYRYILNVCYQWDLSESDIGNILQYNIKADLGIMSSLQTWENTSGKFGNAE